MLSSVKPLSSFDLTAKELVVLNEIKDGDHYEEVPAVSISDLRYALRFSSFKKENITRASLGGILASLYQKEAIAEGEYPDGSTSYHLLVAEEDLQK